MRDYTNQTGNSDGRRFGPEFHEKPDDPHDAQRLRAVEKQLRLLAFRPASELEGER